MRDVRLDGIPVVDSWLTQRAYRAAYCDFLLRITPATQSKMLAEFQRAGALGKYRGLQVAGVADLGFLQDFPNLLYLELVDQPRIDVRQLEGLSNLRGLRVQTPGSGIDFSWFPHLEVFVGDWHPDNRNLSRSGELRQLRIWQFKPRAADLMNLAGMVRLERLEITQTQITSLAGVETLEDLRYFEVAYAPKLESLDALASRRLEMRELAIEKAKNVTSYRPIASIERLRRLRLSACAPMPDLKWTAGMNYLDSFSFVNTDVQDGDLKPLLQLPKLQYAGMMDKRTYNMKFAALNEQLQQRVAVGYPG